MIRVSKRIANITASSTLAITAKAKELRSQGHDVINFAGGEPDFDTPEYIKQAAINALSEGFTKYTPSIGILPLRQAIAQKLNEDNSLEYTPNQIVVSCGAKHAIFNLIQALAEEDDEVLIPVPYWVSYPEMVKLAGATPRFVETNEASKFKMTADNLSKALTPKTKILIFNSPSNPTGIVYGKEDLLAIADICVKHKIFVISDEIYEKIIYDGLSYTSIGSLNKNIYNLTATVNGFSKAYSMTGWRIGYFAVSEEIAAAVKKFQDHSTSNPNSIAQKAAIAALKDSEKSISMMREEFQARRDLLMSLLDKIPQLSYIRPQGAFYVFCNIFKLGMDSVTFSKKILEEIKVATIPGAGFGANTYIRLSFSTSREQIEQGIKRISEWIKTI